MDKMLEQNLFHLNGEADKRHEAALFLERMAASETNEHIKRQMMIGVNNLIVEEIGFRRQAFEIRNTFGT